MKNSNLIKKLALGTVQFGLDYGITNQTGQTSKEEVAKILDYAAEIGINAIDTAEAYGNSEELIGSLHNDRFNIVTKIIPDPKQEGALAESLKYNMKKLKVNRLYGVLFHSAQAALQNPAAVKELYAQRETGVVTKVGYSVYTPDELDELIETYQRPDLIQIPFSHLDRRFEDVVRKLHELGTEVHSRSTFLQGLFFADTNNLPVFFNPIKTYLKALNGNFKNNAEKAAYLITHVATKPYITKVVIGINTKAQLLENVKLLKVTTQYPEIEIPAIPPEILMPNLWPKN